MAKHKRGIVSELKSALPKWGRSPVTERLTDPSGRFEIGSQRARGGWGDVPKPRKLKKGRR
jgi:hypothetical protein